MTTEATLTIENTLRRIEKEITYCTNQIEAPMIIRCNCIVATENVDYQIGVNAEHKAEVLIGNFTAPCFFTEKMANEVVANVKASNGFGPLTFKVWRWKDFYKARLQELEKAAELFRNLIQNGCLA